MAAPYGTTYDFGGAITANAYGWNTGTRITQMEEDITLLSHTATDLLSALMGGGPVYSASPEWQTVILDAIDTANAVSEGADYTFQDENVPGRMQNVTYIARKAARVSGTTQAERHHNITDMKMQQVRIRQRELVRDIQWQLINGQITNVNEATARTPRGILQFLASSDAATTGTNLDDFGGLTWDAAGYKALLKLVYDTNFETTDVWMTDKQFEVVNTFISGGGVNTAAGQRNLTSREKGYTDVIEEIGTVYGQIQHHLIRNDYFTSSPYLNTGNDDGIVIALDVPFWHWKWLDTRAPWMEETPKDGDRWSAVLQAEGTLVADAAGQTEALGRGSAGAAQVNIG